MSHKGLNVIDRVKTFSLLYKTKSYPRLKLVSLNWKSEEALKIKVNIRLQNKMVHSKRYSHLLLASVNLSVEGHSEYLRQVVSNGYDKHTFTTYVFSGFRFSLKLQIYFTLSLSYLILKKEIEKTVGWMVWCLTKGKLARLNMLSHLRNTLLFHPFSPLMKFPQN